MYPSPYVHDQKSVLLNAVSSLSYANVFVSVSSLCAHSNFYDKDSTLTI